jgi:hypothetical protein
MIGYLKLSEYSYLQNLITVANSPKMEIKVGIIDAISELATSRKKDNDTMTMKFLLHKNKEENGNPSPQKQECGCPSLQASLRSHTHAFLADPLTANIES